MKIYSLLGIALLSNFAFSQNEAQQNVAPTDIEFCGHTTQTELIFEQHPEYKTQDSIDQVQFQIDYENFLQNDYSPDERVTYTIPVVVHVVHLGGDENISNEQIYDGIEKLNLDFSNTNPDGVNTVAAFQGLRANSDFVFKLATKDPNGNCHSGITRTFSNTTYDTGLSSGSHPIVEAVQAEHGNWPQNKYLNLFICIDPSGAAGYTYRPANWYPTTGMYGGIMLKYTYMGTIGTAGGYAKHTLSHEVGHWFNLAHPWGSTNSPGDSGNCSDDDGVTDGIEVCGTQGANGYGSGIVTAIYSNVIIDIDNGTTYYNDKLATLVNHYGGNTDCNTPADVNNDGTIDAKDPMNDSDGDGRPNIKEKAKGNDPLDFGNKYLWITEKVAGQAMIAKGFVYIPQSDTNDGFWMSKIEARFPYEGTGIDFTSLDNSNVSNVDKTRANNYIATYEDSLQYGTYSNSINLPTQSQYQHLFKINVGTFHADNGFSNCLEVDNRYKDGNVAPTYTTRVCELKNDHEVTDGGTWYNKDGSNSYSGNNPGTDTSFRAASGYIAD